MRRAFWETLVDLVGDLDAPSELGVRIESISMDLPLEVEVFFGRDGMEFLADMPRTRWRTVFDQQPSRLKLHCQETAS
jgi:hypothetical protein